MPTILPLAALGRRIMVLGPTNSGKSTLAAAVAAHFDIPAVHLDRLRHQPDTDWRQRPDAEFHALHALAIAQAEWIMDGSYSRVMPQRLARTSGIIVLDDTLAVRTARYLRRTLWQQQRAGGLDGNRDSIKWEMLAWLWKTRNKSQEARNLATQSGLPHLFVHNGRELNALYAAWGLPRP